MDETLQIPVLVIDDDEAMLEVLRDALEQGGVKNYILCDNEADFEDAITDETHIAIIDHLLGGIHVGLDVIERFELKRKTKIPSSIIIVSGQVNEDIMMRYINDKKVHAYVKKPTAAQGHDGIVHFQREVLKYTQTAISRTLDWINWFKSIEKFK